MSNLLNDRYVNAYSYDENGYIWRIRFALLSDIISDETDCRYVISNEIVNERSHYVNDGMLSPRPVTAIAVSGNVISGLPIPCKVECNGSIYEVDDGIFEYDTPLRGKYSFSIRAFPYVEYVGTLTVE